MKWLLLGVSLALAGCQSTSKTSVLPKRPEESQSWRFLNQFKGQFPPSFSLRRLIQLAQKGDLVQAAAYVNKALEKHPESAPLHLAQGFIWEARAHKGERQANQMAQVAFQTAATLDPTHPLSGYHLGKQYLAQGQADKAQKVMAQTLVNHGDQVKNWYILACASYQNHDLATAYCAMRKVLQLQPQDPCYVRMGAIVFAAAGDRHGALGLLDQYSTMTSHHTSHDIEYVTGRVEYWNRLHQNPALIPTDGMMGGAPVGPQAPENIGIVVDGYILSVQESSSMQKGNNVLNAFDPSQALNPLQVVLGGTSTSSPKQLAFWGQRTDKTQPASGEPKTASIAGTLCSYAVSPVALNYSLNIMNATNTVATYTTRPTVSTLVGKPTALFFGAMLQAAPEGGSLTNIDAGDRLELTVTSIADDGLMSIDVLMSSSSPIGVGPTSSTLSLTQQLIQVSTSKLATTIKAYPGQTIILGGLKNVIKRTRESGVPLLRRLPIVQWFVSSYNEQELSSHIFYLITPRLSSFIDKTASQEAKADQPTPVFQTLQRSDAKAFCVTFQPTLPLILKRLRRSSFASSIRSRDCDLRPISWQESLANRLKMLA